jgi:glycolate oxidase
MNVNKLSASSTFSPKNSKPERRPKMDARLLKKIEAIVSAQHVQASKAALLAYSYDATPNFQALPDVVVAPGNVQEVQALVSLCAEEGIPIVPRGSGTNLAAGTTPTSGGLVMLFHRMNQILELDEENLTIRVQPGVITEHIHKTVERAGFFYPPDPSSMKISTIGGNVSENSGGLRGLKYGVTKDYVMGLEVVLANGEILRTGGKLAKDVAGYDVTSLIVGAEGTLGIVTEILLKLIPLPETKQTMVAIFPSLEEAGSAVSAIISEKITPVTLEFMDNGTIRAVEAHAGIGLPVEAEALLLLEKYRAA